MKPMFESSEVFQAYARIDYCYYMLSEIHKKLKKARTPIERMVDEVAGFAKAKNAELTQKGIELLEEIISSKKIIEGDYANDEKALNELKALKEESEKA